jgi:hypothetical protein
VPNRGQVDPHSISPENSEGTSSMEGSITMAATIMVINAVPPTNVAFQVPNRRPTGGSLSSGNPMLSFVMRH